MKTIFILLLPLLLINSCTLPLFPNPEPDLSKYQNNKPLCGNNYFTILHLEQGDRCLEILGQGTNVWKNLQHWLEFPLPTSPVPILIFSDKDSIGRYFLRRSQTRHRSTGHYDSPENILFLIGQLDDPRFATVLRHEATHAALHNAYSDSRKLPFWADEGIACLMETLPGGLKTPPGNIERLQLVHYLQDRDQTLNFTGLVKNPHKRIRSGEVYARSWALTSCLYHNKRPVKLFLLHSLRARHNTAVAIFNETLLKQDESFADFENDCYDWLYSFKNSSH